MRRLALAVITLLLVPAGASGKDPDAPVRVLWNSAPDDIRAGGTWDARLSLLQGPGGFDAGHARPVVRVTAAASAAERRVRMTGDIPPNTFRAAVSFPRTGLYRVAVAGFDPGDRGRSVGLGAAVEIGSAPASAETADDSAASWRWALAAAAALAALLVGVLGIPRLRAARSQPDA